MSVSIFIDPKNTFRQATAEDIPSILALVERVRANLSEAEQHFLKEKSAVDLAAFIHAGFPTVLAFRDNQLAAVAVSTPQNPEMNLGANNLHGMFNRGHYMCIGTVAVSPDMRGMGMGQQIVAKAFEASSDYINLTNSENPDSRLTAVLAKVSTVNTSSQRAFLANEFNQAPQVFDDTQGGYQFQVFSRLADNLPALSTESIVGERERRIADTRNGPPMLHHS